MQTPRRQGRPPVLENAYERILDGAAVLFAQKGFDASSISEIATTVGMSKAAVFHYFPAKQDIYDAIIVRALRGLKDQVSDAVNNDNASLDRLRLFMTSHANYFEENFWSFVTMLIGYGGMATPTLKQEALALRDEYESLLREIIREGVKQEQIKDVDPVDASRAILSMLNWMARWFKPGGERSAAQVAEDYYSIIVGGLKRA
ncbi:TetR/AcrR family transcriptional regulator (plasmid) [Agrobacterium tumefaciens]|jgi:AcrR family transcriptional regulator|uniref:TetR/AcrR family transcriptional regulator n=1 Tax=Agrobacterium tumefaciens TaxID=358 RepID=UPI001574B261|nr:TetR/AcrR family transcriptional regulator [Agrobacterium tumefaciens]NSZ75026.1 TetR/AcrR family transcriptional regulator [Agrobacterium tumefaciens]NSZ87097.1 TetR/AcrR family transcriptional regulator [Agrobacterium tumefaciens]WCA72637.1 TetR/AcrR family transcriptional regulator [Agrobacterium tumefaciens]